VGALLAQSVQPGNSDNQIKFIGMGILPRKGRPQGAPLQAVFFKRAFNFVFFEKKTKPKPAPFRIKQYCAKKCEKINAGECRVDLFKAA